MRIMRISGMTILLLTIAASTVAAAQLAPAPADHGPDRRPRPELALDYTFIRSNAPPGGCGCFNLNGGSAEFVYPTSIAGLGIMGDITTSHAGNIGSSNLGLTLSSFTGGARYTRPTKLLRYQPFAQLSVGLAHASGSLVQGQTATSTNALAVNLGGGLDVRVNRRVSLRLLEADYLLTTFANGINDHENLLRLSSGVVLSF